MTANALRCRIIAHVLKADRLHLVALQDLCQSQQAIDLPADLPDWLSLAHAADLLHLHPAHLRRLAQERYPLQVEKRTTAKGQLGTFIAASAIREIARATPRQPRATRPQKSAHLRRDAHLPTRAQLPPQNRDSDAVATAANPSSKEPVPSKLWRAPDPAAPAPSKLHAAPDADA